MALIRRVATVSSWTLVSRILGLVRDRLLAGAFGGSLLLSAFLVAFQLPNLLRNLFGEGALAAAFIPRYVRQREQDPAAGEAFAGLVLTRLCCGLGLLAGLGMALAAGIAAWGAPDWALIAALAIPQLPYLVFICASAIMAGALHGRRHFATPAAAPVLLNVVLIVVLLIDADIWILPYAILGIGILQAAVHLLALARTGGVPRLAWRRTPALHELWRAFLPTVLATGVYQLNALLDSLIAFVLVPGAGAVTYLYFGNRLLQFPMALIGHGVHTAIYPELASAANADADGPWRQTGDRLRQGTALVAGLLLPATVGLVICAEPLVATLYGTGAFDATDIARTVLVTQCFALSLVPISLSKLAVKAFHSHQDQRTPLRIGLATVAGNLLLNLILVQTPLQEAGLALASGISGLAGVGVYFLLLHWRGTGALLPRGALIHFGLASLTMGAGVWSLDQWLFKDLPAWQRLGLGVAIGTACYIVLAGLALRNCYRRARPG